MLLAFANLEKETQERWNSNRFLEYGKLPYSEESSYLKSLTEVTPWEPYEDYMFARLVAAIPGKVGLLHIKFPPDMVEDSRLHIHRHSDRVITVLDGSGQFLVANRGEAIQSIRLEKGNRLWMPRGIRHTFYAGSNGLLLESIHNPFFAFNDPRLLEYDEQAGYVEFARDGSFVEVKRVRRIA
jgi:mannose-6-phosphate isomerase-like protein (cupin superfamily)